MYPLGFDFEMGSSSDLFGKGVSLGFIWYPLGFDFEIGSPSDLFGRGVSLGFIWYPLGFDFEIGSPSDLFDTPLNLVLPQLGYGVSLSAGGRLFQCGTTPRSSLLWLP